jgi:hypothetical protein
LAKNSSAVRELRVENLRAEMPTSLLDYPDFFNEKLRSNLKVRSAIDSSLTLVSDILQISKLPFFPDYTDHGAPHLNKVLEIADKLIAEGARKLFSAEDAAVLTFSALLHDLALHLSEAGFQSLLRAPSWADRWREFLSTAKHWDDRKLVEVFGADETGAPLALAKDPFDHYSNLTESDRKLIGEFIRQQHPQLAYQFAMVGFPGTAGQIIPFGPFDEDLRELAGIIARSHGFPLREGIRQLEQKQFSKLEHGNVHPVFLMFKEVLSHGALPQLVAAEVCLGPSQSSTVQTGCSVGRVWTQVIKHPLILFDPIERHRKLNHAYNALSEYLADFAGPKDLRPRTRR